MALNQETVLVLALDLTKANRQREEFLRGFGGGTPGAPSGPGRVPGGSAVPQSPLTPRPGVPGSPQDAGGALGLDRGATGLLSGLTRLVPQVTAAVAAFALLRDSLGNVRDALGNVTDVAGRSISRWLGLDEVGARARGASSAQQTTIEQLGLAGAFASDAQIQGLFSANRRLADLREQSRLRVQRATDPAVLSSSLPSWLVPDTSSVVQAVARTVHR